MGRSRDPPAGASETARASPRTGAGRFRAFVRRIIAPRAFVGLIWRYCSASISSTDAARKLALNIAAVVGLGFGLAFIFKSAFFKDSVVIDPISVPKELADRGYTGDVVAQRIHDKVREIYKTREMNDERVESHPTDFTTTPLERSMPPIELPGGKMSLAAVVSAVRELFGYGNPNITGELTIEESSASGAAAGSSGRPQTRYWLSLRRTDKDAIAHTEPSEKLEELFQSAALHVVEKIDPYHAASYYFATRDYAKASQLANEALNNLRRDDDLDARILQTRIARAKGYHDEALDELRHIQELFPHSPKPRQQIASVLIFKRSYAEALEAAQEAIERAARDGERSARAHNLAGVALIYMKRYDEALTFLRKSNELDPKFAAAYFNQGFLLKDRHPPDEPGAVAMFRKAIDANPYYARAFTSWAALERKAGRLDKAKRLSEKAIAADPKFATAYNLRGEILLEQMHLKEAIGMFDRARAANRTWSTPLYNRGRALRLSGDFDGAIAAFKEVTKQSHHARAYAQWGLALAQKAAKEQAADERATAAVNEALGQALRYGPEDKQVLADVEEARALLRHPDKVVESSPIPSD
jgi:tetratricopeptide (TPR) repeat protein